MGYALVILSFVFDMSGEKHSDFEQTRVLQRSFLRILGQYTTLLNQVTPILESHVNHWQVKPPQFLNMFFGKKKILNQLWPTSFC